MFVISIKIKERNNESSIPMSTFNLAVNDEQFEVHLLLEKSGVACGQVIQAKCGTNVTAGIMRLARAIKYGKRQYITLDMLPKVLSDVSPIIESMKGTRSTFDEPKVRYARVVAIGLMRAASRSLDIILEPFSISYSDFDVLELAELGSDKPCDLQKYLLPVRQDRPESPRPFTQPREHSVPAIEYSPDQLLSVVTKHFPHHSDHDLLVVQNMWGTSGQDLVKFLQAYAQLMQVLSQSMQSNAKLSKEIELMELAAKETREQQAAAAQEAREQQAAAAQETREQQAAAAQEAREQQAAAAKETLEQQAAAAAKDLETKEEEIISIREKRKQDAEIANLKIERLKKKNRKDKTEVPADSGTQPSVVREEPTSLPGRRVIGGTAYCGRAPEACDIRRFSGIFDKAAHQLRLFTEKTNQQKKSYILAKETKATHEVLQAIPGHAFVGEKLGTRFSETPKRNPEVEVEAFIGLFIHNEKRTARVLLRR
jgi:chemotaxis protein histidine kinase CheA/uncharacterized membrane protein YciS (DUF1049 family)